MKDEADALVLHPNCEVIDHYLSCVYINEVQTRCET